MCYKYICYIQYKFFSWFLTIPNYIFLYLWIWSVILLNYNFFQDRSQLKYYQKKENCLLLDYMKLELKKKVGFWFRLQNFCSACFVTRASLVNILKLQEKLLLLAGQLFSETLELETCHTLIKFDSFSASKHLTWKVFTSLNQISSRKNCCFC